MKEIKQLNEVFTRCFIKKERHHHRDISVSFVKHIIYEDQ